MADWDGDSIDDETGERLPGPFWGTGWSRAERDSWQQAARDEGDYSGGEGGRQARFRGDRDAGPGGGGSGGFGGGGGGGGSGGGRSGDWYDTDDPGHERNVTPTERVLEGIPIVNWFTPNWSQDARERDARERREQLIESYLGTLPTANELYTDERYIGAGYDPEQVATDPESRTVQFRALSQLQDIADDGMTAADRAQMELGRQEIGQSMRATRDADLAALEARGAGGSGAALRSRLGTASAGASALSQRDAQMQIAAQQRRMAALEAQGALASRVRGQAFDEGAWNADQRTRFNETDTSYRRSQEQRRAESRVQSRRDAAGYRERGVALADSQYQGGDGRERRDDEDDDKAAGLIEGLIRSAAG